MSFTGILERVKKETGLGTVKTEDLVAELTGRQQSKNPFPLEVFNHKVQPFINALAKEYDIPRSFIGLSMLSVYSSAIGTAYTVSTNDVDHFHLTIWACLWGMSSSGKSLALGKIYKVLQGMQNDLDVQWAEETKGLTFDQMARKEMKTILFRDVHLATLTRMVLPVNPKGITKVADELMEWINGMNQLSKKEGTDEQFWISTWNCHNYSGIRSGNQKFVNQRPFVNVIGGTQDAMISRLMGKDRDTTGFIFRLLFAKPEIDRLADVDPYFEMPPEWQMQHDNCVRLMHNELPVDSFEDKPKRCLLTKDAVKMYHHWVKGHVGRINSISDAGERNIQGGIFGKMKEYALRFSALLAISDKAIDIANNEGFEKYFPNLLPISINELDRGLKLANYFFNSAWDAYDYSRVSVTAPYDVVVAATMMRSGKSHSQIAQVVMGKDTKAATQKMRRQIKKWIVDYPRLFGAQTTK